MSRRVSLPAADDLFRPTAVPEEVQPKPARQEPRRVEEARRAADEATDQAAAPADDRDADEAGSASRQKQPSGRVRHDEKMTVYVTAEELLDLEHTRLRLRALGLSVDRGRLVREAVAIALADFEANGQDSLLARRLTGS